MQPWPGGSILKKLKVFFIVIADNYSQCITKENISDDSQMLHDILAYYAINIHPVGLLFTHANNNKRGHHMHAKAKVWNINQNQLEKNSLLFG